MIRAIQLAIAFTVCAAPAFADTIRVPQDKATIQLAIDDAGPLDEVVIDEGVYNENLVMDGKTAVQVRGKGNVRVNGSGATPTLNLTSCAFVQLKHLKLVAGAAQALRLDSSVLITVEDCAIVGGAGGPALTTGFASELVVRDCRIDGGGGLDLHSDRCVIRDTAVNDSTGIGIFISGDHNRVENCKVAGAAGHGISVGSFSASAVQAVVVGNDVADAGGDGIRVDDQATRTLVRGNKITRATANGITVTTNGSLGGIVTDNDVSKCGGRGISVDADSVTVDGNRVKKCTQHGIETTANAGQALITGNRCSKNQGLGYLIAGSTNTVSRNSEKGNVAGAVNDSGTANHYIDNGFDPPILE